MRDSFETKDSFEFVEMEASGLEVVVAAGTTETATPHSDNANSAGCKMSYVAPDRQDNPNSTGWKSELGTNEVGHGGNSFLLDYDFIA